MELHHLHPELLKHRVRVLVVCCGGNGSAVAAGLPYLHQALLAYGHPEGLQVSLLDPDVISPTNCVRQPFSQSEIGLYKSVVLANRLNLFWGLDWEGIPEKLDPKRRLDGVEIVIGCVDTRKARAAIAKCAGDWSEVITTILCRITRTLKGWAEPGETITRTISRQHIGGATLRKGQCGWTSDYRLTGQEIPRSPTCQVFNDLPRSWFFGVSLMPHAA